MFDVASRSEAQPPPLARADAALTLGFARRGEKTVLAELRQEGSLYARFPGGAGCTAVTLNNGGGIAGGDRFRLHATWQPGTRATVTAAAAEKVYRARAADAPACVQTALVVGEGAVAEWLPQETILFDGARLDRTLSVTLAPGARFLGVEALVFGRTARGERFAHGALVDRFQVSRDGRPLLHDAIRLSGDIAALLDRPAIAAGACAVGTLVRVSPDAALRLDLLQDALGQAGAASAWDGMLAARLVAADGARLRQAIVAALAVLRDDPLPRTWLC